MGRFIGYVACPRCRERGADRRGDNLAQYTDGSAHCFACGHHVHAKRYVPKVSHDRQEAKAALPRDFTREVPAAAWKWLLQYGLPYSYWKPYTGYSPAEERLILTVGNPIIFSIGRYCGKDKEQRKWKQYGDRSGVVAILENQNPDSAEGPVILVEDYISGHKVRASGFTTVTLFGTTLYPKVLSSLRALKRPTSLWLDEDQWGVLPQKINRLQTFLDVPVWFIRKRKDPKEYTIEEIKEIINVERTTTMQTPV